MLIPLDRIDDTTPHLRRTAASAQAQAALEGSIRALGVLQPVLLRADGAVYRVIAGRRRVQAARAVGLTEIPAEIMALEGTAAIAAEGAENLVRAPMDMLDQWAAVRALMDGGMSAIEASAAWGLDERKTRRMDRLARLHPDVLAKIEEFGPPADHVLGAIAAATPAQQKAGLKAASHDARDKSFDWFSVYIACSVRRISRSVAIFDVAKSRIVFEEDLFAPPDTPEQFTTRDVAKFLAAQTAALAERVAAAKKAERLQLAAIDAKGEPVLPSGWSWAHQPITKTLLRSPAYAVLTWVQQDGADAGEVRQETIVDKKALRAAEKKAAQAAAAPAPAGDAGSTDDTGDIPADAPSAPQPEPDSPGLTKAGQQLVADAKTLALRARLTSMEDVSAETLLCLMVLALGAANVQVYGEKSSFVLTQFRDLAAELLEPGGNLVPNHRTMAVDVACRALARVLRVRGPVSAHGSGDPAEWIGHTIDAQDSLPRFDTAEVLACVGAAELRAIAAPLGIKAKTAGELRRQLAGQAPDWRPAAAVFGAPAPVVQREDADENE